MAVRTTVRLADRHHRFLKDRVAEGEHASISAAVEAAVERMMEDERARDSALDAMAGEIRRRAATPREEFLDHETVFGRWSKRRGS